MVVFIWVTIFWLTLAVKFTESHPFEIPASPASVYLSAHRIERDIGYSFHHAVSAGFFEIAAMKMAEHLFHLTFCPAAEMTAP